MMSINVPNGALSIIKALDSKGFRAYVVGGCVRDSVMGVEPKDWDICTSATPEEVKNVIECEADSIIDTGIKHGTVTAFIEGKGYEITTFRKDGDYNDGRRPNSVRFVSELEEDLVRRDFTINAMAYDPIRDVIIDYFNGIDDIGKGKIRCVGEPLQRFQEDGLRILRGIRFSSILDFSIDKETSDAMFKSAFMLEKVSAERKTSEIIKMISGARVDKIIKEYYPIINRGISNTTVVLKGYELECAEWLAKYKGDDISIRLALLFSNKESIEPILQDMKLDNRTMENISFLLNNKDIQIELGRTQLKHKMKIMGVENLKRLITFLRFYKRKGAKFEQLAYGKIDDILSSGECFNLKQLKVNGNDLQQNEICKGVFIGRVLDYLLDGVIFGIIPNEKSKLLQSAINWVKHNL